VVHAFADLAEAPRCNWLADVYQTEEPKKVLRAGAAWPLLDIHRTQPMTKTQRSTSGSVRLRTGPALEHRPRFVIRPR
jgi:hypothetical protein